MGKKSIIVDTNYLMSKIMKIECFKKKNERKKTDFQCIMIILIYWKNIV